MVENNIAYTYIKIPKYVMMWIEDIKARTGLSEEQIIIKALDHYYTLVRLPHRKKDLPRLDKVSWYIIKLVSALTYFKVNYTEQQKHRFMEVLNQIEERMKVDCSVVKDILKNIRTRGGRMPTDVIIELTGAVKLVIADMIVTHLFNEEKTF